MDDHTQFGDQASCVGAARRVPYRPSPRRPYRTRNRSACSCSASTARWCASSLSFSVCSRSHQQQEEEEKIHNECNTLGGLTKHESRMTSAPLDWPNERPRPITCAARNALFSLSLSLSLLAFAFFHQLVLDLGGSGLPPPAFGEDRSGRGGGGLEGAGSRPRQGDSRWAPAVVV